MRKPRTLPTPAQLRRRAKRFNKRIELLASYLNGAALAVLALGVFRFVLDASPNAPPIENRTILQLVLLSIALHVLAQVSYALLRPEED